MKQGTSIPRPGEGKRGPDGHLGYLVRQANVAVRAAMAERLTGFFGLGIFAGLTYERAQLLAIGRGEAIHQ